MIGKVIFTVLSNDADVVAIVPATRIKPFLARENIRYPYIVYEKVTQDPTDEKDGKSLLDIAVYDILIYSKTLVQLEDLGTKVRNALDRYSATVSGVYVQSVKLVAQETDYSDDPDRIYILGQSYSFRFETIYNRLGRPTNLTAVAASSTQINLAWTDNSTGETGYQVWRSADAVIYTLVASIAANSVSYSNTGLVAASHYSYKVRSTNANGGGQWSNVVICSTLTASTTKIKALFGTAETTMRSLTIDADNSGTYTSISDDGSSGTITLNINGGGYAAFVNPTVLSVSDTLLIKRTISTATGSVTLTGNE